MKVKWFDKECQAIDYKRKNLKGTKHFKWVVQGNALVKIKRKDTKATRILYKKLRI